MEELLFGPGLVTVDADVATSGEAIAKAAEAGIRRGLLTDEYLEAVLARETQFPTGLPTEPVGVAIPHADGTGDRRSLSVLRTRDTVEFREMGTSAGTVGVRLLFLLNLADKDTLGLLGVLATLVQDPVRMDVLLTADASGVCDTVSAALASAGIARTDVP